MTRRVGAPRVVIIGGGIGGTVAARELARGGAEVTLLERGSRLGGLVVSFSVGGTPLECFYHHTFPHERQLVDLVTELGLGDRLDWLPSSVGVLTDGRLWPFTTPRDLLTFQPLPLPARVRTGLAALRLMRSTDWRALDGVTALDWLAAASGSDGTRVIWEPLLRAKFGPAAPRVPAAWMYGRFRQRQGARSAGSSGETLGYLRGGFVQLFDALADDLLRRGVDIRYESTVTEVLTEDDRVIGVRVGETVIDADAVLWTGPIPGLAALTGEMADPRWTAVGGLGVLCVVLELTKPLSPIYWTNVCDRSLPFGGIIEHTNLVPASDYGGRHIVYLSRYFTPEEEVARADPEIEARRWLEAVLATFPHVTDSDVLAVHPFRAGYAAPLVATGHLARIAPLRSHVPGLYVSTTSQIYPEDRGMNEGVRTGIEAGHAIAADLRGEVPAASCPSCLGSRLERAFRPRPGRTEAGVDPDVFAPSSQSFGTTVSPILRCADCGHGVVETLPDPHGVAVAYEDAADPVSLSEEAGQVETGRRTIAAVQRLLTPGLWLDVGAWTGSLLVAARELGWQPLGLEPSAWATARAKQRGLDVLPWGWDDAPANALPAAGSVAVISFCDVLEHLADPTSAVRWASSLLAPDGALLITVPDAGSVMARTLGARWWSVLPMHLQYFTRGSLAAMLAREGFAVGHVSTHPKAFSARYYADQLASFVPVGGSVVRRFGNLPAAARLVSPDFGDRMVVVASRA